ncbi:MAG: hypothetical protein O3A13_12590 [Proteobacteria bacterium]|nr:hypothetical protein [Pseudomonadota bacterium]MDA0994452.1 hypothetical protein [Pseudomonadota bacterium]
MSSDAGRNFLSTKDPVKNDSSYLGSGVNEIVVNERNKGRSSRLDEILSQFFLGRSNGK